jgi:hypothetical protein
MNILLLLLLLLLGRVLIILYLKKKHVSTVYTVADVLYLQFVIHVLLFARDIRYVFLH